MLAYFDDRILQPGLTGTFDAQTENAVRAFQTQQGLTPDGIIGRETWNAIVRQYDRTRSSYAADFPAGDLYPGLVLTPGMSGREVEILQSFLIGAAKKHPEISLIDATGVYDAATENAVRALQRLASLPVSGVTGALTWDAAVRLSRK